MLVESLTHIRSKNKVVLVFLVYIMDAVSFASWIGKSRDNVVLNYFRTFIVSVLFYSKGWIWRISYSIIVIYPLIGKALRSWYHAVLDETLNWARQCIIILLYQLILYERRNGIPWCSNLFFRSAFTLSSIIVFSGLLSFRSLWRQETLRNFFGSISVWRYDAIFDFG